MATATKICKVCGKEYPYCRTERRVAGLFRWQDVACSIEHGTIYFNEVLASRGEKPATDLPEEVNETVEAKNTSSGDSHDVVAKPKRSRKTSANNENN